MDFSMLYVKKTNRQQVMAWTCFHNLYQALFYSSPYGCLDWNGLPFPGTRLHKHGSHYQPRRSSYDALISGKFSR
jgi:hypothetical protein